MLQPLVGSLRTNPRAFDSSPGHCGQSAKHASSAVTAAVITAAVVALVAVLAAPAALGAVTTTTYVDAVVAPMAADAAACSGRYHCHRIWQGLDPVPCVRIPLLFPSLSPPSPAASPASPVLSPLAFSPPCSLFHGGGFTGTCPNGIWAWLEAIRGARGVFALGHGSQPFAVPVAVEVGQFYLPRADTPDLAPGRLANCYGATLHGHPSQAPPPPFSPKYAFSPWARDV